MAEPQRQMAEAFALKSGYGRLAMNDMPHKVLTATRSANSAVTDSAAAATAIACGVKTRNSSLGVDPDGNRLTSVAEVAKARGMKVAVMTTVTILHATPGGFYAHRSSRSDEYGIGLDLIASGFDFFAGGGFSRRTRDKKHALYRGDIIDLAKESGYEVATRPEQFCSFVPGGKALYVPGSFSYSIDIAPGDRAPTLSALVAKAVELLDGEKGFFIMCEGGEIDHAGHANDAATSVHDMLEFDRSVKVAKDFLEKHPDETLILVTGDHETGGLSLDTAAEGTDIAYLGLQRRSAGRYSSHVQRRIRKAGGRLTLKDLERDLAENFGFVFPGAKKPEKGLFVTLTEDDMKKLETTLERDAALVRARMAETTDYMAKRRYEFALAAKSILNRHAGVKWKTAGHTALPTLTTAIGACSDIVRTMKDNTEISIRLKELIAPFRYAACRRMPQSPCVEIAL